MLTQPATPAHRDLADRTAASSIRATRARTTLPSIACARRSASSDSRFPCLARSDGEIVDGHLRLKAARKLGMPEENPGDPLR